MAARSFSLSVRQNLLVGAALVVAGLAAALLVNRHDRALALDLAEARALGTLERSLAIHSFLNKELKPAVFAIAGIGRAPYDAHWMSSSYAIRRIEEMSKDHVVTGARYREAVVGARHPSSEADATERAFLEDSRRDPRLEFRSGIREIGGERYLEVLRRGEVVDQSCLLCHGRPEEAPPGLVSVYGSERGFGWVPGTLVSALAVRVPVEEALAEADRFSLRFAISLLVVLALALVAQHWVQRRLVHEPLERLRRAAARVAAGERSGGGAVTARDAQELQELGKAFAAMEEQVERRREELERTVEARTAELVRANQDLERAAREREAADALLRQSQKMEAVGRLAGGVAHDFNNLLTAIAGATAELQDGLTRGDPRLESVAEIRGASERAATLTRQLLAFSRRDVVRPRRVDLNALLFDSRRLLSRLVREDVELVVEPAPGVAPVEADPAQLQQVVLNLVVNARDAIPGAGRITLALRPSEGGGPDPVPAGPWLVLSVRDTGVGMDETTLASVFEPFFTTKEPGRGTGLGLATVYSIVKALGGHVFAQSRPGDGAEFRIWLPRAAEAPATAAAEPGRAPAARPAVKPADRGVALVVEDEPAVRRIATRALARDGWRVIEAEDGEAALAAVRAHAGPITVVVTDVVMPGMRGPELAARLAVELGAALPVVYMSGYAESDGARAELAQSFFVQKPFRPGELAEAAALAVEAAAQKGEAA